MSQFLVGLCMAANDLTLLVRRVEQVPEGNTGESNYYLYLLCSYYREATKYVHGWLSDAEISAFLDDLSPQGREHMDKVIESFAPWDDSFVKNDLKPVRNIIFHYTRNPSDMQSCLERVSDIRSHIELGDGTYFETRYGFSDDVLATSVANAWGDSIPQLKSVMEQVVELALAFRYFASHVVTLRLERVHPDVLEVTERGCLRRIRGWIKRKIGRRRAFMTFSRATRRPVQSDHARPAVWRQIEDVLRDAARWAG